MTRKEGDEADQAEADLRHEVLAPGLLQQVTGALERGNRADVLEDDDRHGQERHHVPSRADELPMMRPRNPKRSSMAWMMTETVAERTAHGRMRCSRVRDAERHAERHVAALEALVAPAQSAARK